MVSLWGASSLIKSVQTAAPLIGTGATSGTATISEVKTENTILIYGGNRTLGNAGSLIQAALPNVTLTNATTVTASKYASSAITYNNVVAVTVVEFQPGVVKSIQYVQWLFVGITSGDTQAITSVNTTKSLVMFLGNHNTAGTWSPNFCQPTVVLNSSTQLGISCGQDPYGSGYDNYPRVCVMEFY